MKVLLDLTIVFQKGTPWTTTEDVERDLAKWLSGLGYEAERLHNPGKLGLSIQKKSGDFPTVPETKPVNPNAGAGQNLSGDYSSLLETLKKARPDKPKLKIFRDSIL